MGIQSSIPTLERNGAVWLAGEASGDFIASLVIREGLIVKEALVKIEALKADFPDAVEQLTRFIEFIGSSPRGVIR